MLPEPNEIDVWCVPLDAAPDLRAVLTEEERARADRFRFEVHRKRYVAARGILRTTLGRCLEADPAGLRFEYEENGKPYLAGTPVEFNISHSQGLAAVAVARSRRLGVDVELIRPLVSANDIASRFFTPEEAAALCALPPGEHEAAFFSLWTRKESYIKAVGAGLSMPLNAVVAAPWRIEEFVPEAGAIGAVCAEGAGWELRLHRFVP